VVQNITVGPTSIQGQFAIVRTTYASDALPPRWEIVIQSRLPWPFMLSVAEIYSGGDQTNRVFDILGPTILACPNVGSSPPGLNLCDQLTTLLLSDCSPIPGGTIFVSFNLTCRPAVAPANCPAPSTPPEEVISTAVQVITGDACPTSGVLIDLSGTLASYTDTTYTTLSNTFYATDNAYFQAVLSSTEATIVGVSLGNPPNVEETTTNTAIGLNGFVVLETCPGTPSNAICFMLPMQQAPFDLPSAQVQTFSIQVTVLAQFLNGFKKDILSTPQPMVIESNFDVITKHGNQNTISVDADKCSMCLIIPAAASLLLLVITIVVLILFKKTKRNTFVKY